MNCKKLKKKLTSKSFDNSMLQAPTYTVQEGGEYQTN
jgi:hypothetical protein